MIVIEVTWPGVSSTGQREIHTYVPAIEDGRANTLGGSGSVVLAMHDLLRMRLVAATKETSCFDSFPGLRARLAPSLSSS